jgi:hypothetical protein
VVSPKRTSLLLLLALLSCTVGLSRRVFAEAFLCSSGLRDGLSCTTHADCPSGACVRAGGACSGATDPLDVPCDCPGGTCSATTSTCMGGSSAGIGCRPSLNCTAGHSCVATQKICVGGDEKGLFCLSNDQCPQSTCHSTGEFCVDSTCAGGTNAGASCEEDSECPQGSCLPDFPLFTCVDDGTCCHDPAACPAGSCAVPGIAATPTRTPTGPMPGTTATPTPTGPRLTPTATGSTTVVPSHTATRTPLPGPGARLASSISSSAETVTLDDASSFPGTCGKFQVDQEVMGYVGKLGNSLTNVVRGQNGTVAVAHSAGARATYIPATGPLTCEVTSNGGCSLSGRNQGHMPLLLLSGGLIAWILRTRRG